MTPLRLQKYFQQQSLRWSIIGLLLTALFSIPCLLYSQKIASEHQLNVLARSVSRAFRPMILTENIRDAELQMRNALDLKPGESVVVRRPDLTAIYPLSEMDNTAKCTIPLTACWGSGFRLVSTLSPIYFDDHGRILYGYIELSIHPERDMGTITILIFLLIFAFITQTIGLASALNESAQKIISALSLWAHYLEKNLQSQLSESPAAPYVEFEPMKKAVDGLYSEITKLKVKTALSAKVEGQVSLAKQVAHDIRSPLSALNMVLTSVGDLPEEKRILARSAITRIKDIANNLLNQKGQGEPRIEELEVTILNHSKQSIHLISSLLEDLVSEKRCQYRTSLNIEIDYQPSADSYGIFACINSSEFKRILSNLINNSVEAFSKNEGMVHLDLKRSSNEMICEITDNGKGIPARLLPQLGQRGKSFGKEGTESGSGLGLFHAIETVKFWGGKLEIESFEGQGTTVRIRLPLETAPNWFVKDLEIPSKGQLVVIDDDSSIHQIWNSRLSSINLGCNNVQILHFSSPKDVKAWIVNQRSLSQTIFLVDYEFLGEADSGLDLIEEFKIFKNAILVTSRYEEAHVMAKAVEMGVRLIPKGMAGLIPIQFQTCE